ncbi:MAG: hypothetical protein ACFFD1_14005, partial [Candidatus Thorarchaeota archaeon]
MISTDFVKNADFSKLTINNPRKIFSIFVPLGENSIIRLVDLMRSRKDVEVLDTDLYYTLRIKYSDYTISFYSRGLITFEKQSHVEKLGEMIGKIQILKRTIPDLIFDLLTEYHISLLEVLGDIQSLHKTIHKTIVVGSFGELTLNEDPKSTLSVNDLSDEKRLMFIKNLANSTLINDFIGDPRSIDTRTYEDIIIGTKGSIIRSEDIDTLLSFHAYIRAIHLFLNQYNEQIEKEWTYLNECDTLFNDLEQNLMSSKDRLNKAIFSEDQRELLAKTKMRIIEGVKRIDSYLVLTKFLEDSIHFTSKKFDELKKENKIRENSFEISMVLQAKIDRIKDLKIISENFENRGKTLVTRIDLYDQTISFELDQRAEKLKAITQSWTRTYTFGIKKAKIRVPANTVLIKNARIIFSVYLPIGENSIIQLVDNFRKNKDTTIINTDLYHFIEINYMNFTFKFYSRGLVTIESNLNNGTVVEAIDDAESLMKEIPFLLENLLTNYQLSLIEVIGKIEAIPLHKTIVVEFIEKIKSEDDNEDEERDEFLKGLAEDKTILRFIGLPRSIDSRPYEDVVIGT